MSILQRTERDREELQRAKRAFERAVHLVVTVVLVSMPLVLAYVEWYAWPIPPDGTQGFATVFFGGVGVLMAAMTWLSRPEALPDRVPVARARFRADATRMAPSTRRSPKVSTRTRVC